MYILHRRFYTEYKLQDDEQQELTDKLKFYVLDLTAADLATETDKTNGLVEWAKAFNAKNWDAVNQIERKGIKEAANTMEVIMATPSQRQVAKSAGKTPGANVLLEP